MTEREKLISLIYDYIYLPNNLLIKEIEQIVDYLLDNGVRCPPCQVGDTVYLTIENEVVEDVVLFIHYDDEFFFTSSFSDGLLLGESMFLTREEAEKALSNKSDTYTEEELLQIDPLT